MKIILLFFTVACIWGYTTIKKTNEISKTDWKQATTAFKDLNEALQKENGQLWDHSLQGPILLVNRNTRAIIANEKDNSGELSKRGALYVGKLPEDINISNTAFDWNGKRWTMVALPLPETKAKRLNLLIHESFHRIQPLIGFDSLREAQCAHLDSKEGRILLKLELEALKKALISDDPRIHIKNALLFRQYRYQLFPEAKRKENSLELNEGLAEYTGSMLSGRNNSDLKNHFISEIDRFYALPTFVRSFPYFTMPVYGYFMQQPDKKWNLRINENTNLTDFISDFFEVNHLDLTNERIMQIGAMYGIDPITKDETARFVKREEQINKYKRIFLGDSVIVIGLENMKIAFNPSNIMPLESLGTVYPDLRITDSWGILKVDSCGALVNAEWNKVTISYPESITDTLISGKGWRLVLNKPWKLDKIENKYRLIKEKE